MAYTGNLFFAAPAGSYGNRTWKYENISDSLATIAGSGYFNSVTDQIRQYDVLEITGSDGFKLVQVTSASGAPTVTVADMVGDASVPDGSITNAKLADDTILNGKINSSAGIEFSKLESLNDGQLLVGSPTNVPTAVAMSGDVTIDNSGATTLASGSVDNSHVSASADIAFDKLANLNNGEVLVGNLSNRAAGVNMSGDITIDNTGATTLANDAVSDANVSSSAAISFNKLQDLLDGQILVGNPSNKADGVTMGGDATIDNSGQVTLANNSVGVDQIENGAITNSEISGSAAIDFSKLASLTDGQLLIGSPGNQVSAVAMGGDATIDNSGQLSLANDVVENANVASNAAIAFSKLESLTDGNILVGNPGNTAASVSMSGDATMDNSGAVSLAADSVDSAELADNAVGGAALANYAVDDVAAAAPLMLVFDLAGGATANQDKTITHKMTVTGFEIINKADGTAGDTMQLQTGTSTAVSDVLSIGGVDNSKVYAGTIDHANSVFAASSTMRFSRVDGGGNDSPAVRVIVHGFKTA